MLAIVKEIEKRKYFSDTKSWRFPKEEFKNLTDILKENYIQYETNIQE